jgi:hypothetical protein
MITQTPLYSILFHLLTLSNLHHTFLNIWTFASATECSAVHILMRQNKTHTNIPGNKTRMVLLTCLNQGWPKTRVCYTQAHQLGTPSNYPIYNFFGLGQGWWTFLRAGAHIADNFWRNSLPCVCVNLSSLAPYFQIIQWQQLKPPNHQ